MNLRVFVYYAGPVWYTDPGMYWDKHVSFPLFSSIVDMDNSFFALRIVLWHCVHADRTQLIHARKGLSTVYEGALLVMSVC